MDDTTLSRPWPRRDGSSLAGAERRFGWPMLSTLLLLLVLFGLTYVSGADSSSP